MDHGKRFREISDQHEQETGEHLFSGASHRGPGEPVIYLFSFGAFSDAAKAMTELMEHRNAVPHVLTDSGRRKCPEDYCISGPHPANKPHVDATGKTWRGSLAHTPVRGTRGQG